jgi:elongation factor 1-alpha
MRAPETHIAICGHVKHGKSTLAGRILYELNAISDTELGKLREEARSLGKDFNEFSLMFLKRRSSTFRQKIANLQDDQSRTVFPERGNVKLADGSVLTLIDTPGHSRYLDNTIYGTYLADLAVLVIEASVGVGIGTIGIARILSAFSIPIIAIFVTKMDVVGYSELRFQEVKDEIEQFVLPLVGNHDAYRPPIIPISALSGVGFGRQADELKWFSGINALQALQKAETVNAPEAVKGVRLAIEGGKEVYSPKGIGTVLVGSLETGSIHVGETLILEPASMQEGKPVVIQIRSLQRARSITEEKGENVEIVSARAIVAVATPSLTVPEAKVYLRHGGVFGTSFDHPSVAREIEAEIIFFEPNTVYSGKEYVVLANASRSTARIMTIEGKPRFLYRFDDTELDKRSVLTYDLTKDEYEAREGEMVRAKLSFEQPICIESSKEYQRLTRFILRERNSVVACGRCLRITR